jgi:HEAT repeat protein
MLDTDLPLQRTVMSALSRLDSREAIPGMLKVLSSQSSWGPEDSRDAVVAAFDEMKAIEATPELIKLLTHEQPVVRADSARVLARLRVREAIPKITSLLKDKDDDVRWIIVKSLASLRAKDAAPEVRLRLKDDAGMVRAVAAEALIDLEVPDAAADVRPLLQDNDPGARRAAAEVVGHYGDKESIPALIRLLKDQPDYVTTAAASSLCVLGSDEGIPILLRDAAQRRTGLFALNALRQPGLWQKLKLQCAHGHLIGSRKELTALMEKDTAIPKKYAGILRSDMAWKVGPILLAGNGEQRPCLAAIRYASMTSNEEAILEVDSLKIRSGAEALQFWKDWAASR